jgi:formiminotetrahydrofolate cyclodeaminase
MAEFDFAANTLEDFMLALSSAAPVPGGGSGAAVGGALGMGLGNMVANLSLNKPQYAAHAEEIKSLLNEGIALQKKLLALAKDDGISFPPLLKAFKMPEANKEESDAKKKALSAAALQAALIPLEIAEKAVRALYIVLRVGEICAKTAVSDIGCGALFLQAALGAARYNVLINLPFIDDAENDKKIRGHLDFLFSEGNKAASKALSLVNSTMFS